MKNRPLQLIRLLYINIILMRHGVDKIVFSARFFYPYRFLSYLNPWNWFRSQSRSRGESVRLALEQLGPIFVKFGQMLSTRRDLIPEDIIDELEKLQDSVPAFSADLAKRMVEKKLGKNISELFKTFQDEPFASASIAQVHAATLHDGQQVVVKILRPNIKKIIKRDISLLYFVATLTERFLPQGRRLHPREIVAEFERTIIDELDLMREAANASQLRRNFLSSDLLYIPEVYWPYTRSDILIMERIDGIPISNVKALKEQGMDLKKLAERGVEIFFTQVFRDSFFHADMHPGNIFVSKEDAKNPQYIAVDFGIMGILSPTDQRYIAENLLAFFNRDYRRVALLHVESGWVASDVRVDEFESAIRGVCEPIFERPLKEISFGKLLLRLFQTAGRFHMEVQPQLMLLQKTLLNVEGLGRQLYPDLDLWSTAKPFLQKWVKSRIGVKAILKKFQERAPYWGEKWVDIPDLLYEALQSQKIVKMQQRYKMQEKKSTKPRKNIILIIGYTIILLSLIYLFIPHKIDYQWLSKLFLIVGLLVLLMGSLLKID